MREWFARKGADVGELGQGAGPWQDGRGKPRERVAGRVRGEGSGLAARGGGGVVGQGCGVEGGERALRELGDGRL